MARTLSTPDRKVENRRVVFTFRATPGKNVYVAGSFNGWNPSQHQLFDSNGNGVYEIVLRLPPSEMRLLSPPPMTAWSPRFVMTLA